MIPARRSAVAIIGLALVGCVPFFNNLPVIVSSIQGAMIILEQVEAFVASYFRLHPDAEKEKAIEDGIDKVRSGILAAQKALKGIQDASQAQIDAALKDFQAAWNALVLLVVPIGVRISKPGQNLMISEAEHGVVIEEPELLHLKARR